MNISLIERCDCTERVASTSPLTSISFAPKHYLENGSLSSPQHVTVPKVRSIEHNGVRTMWFDRTTTKCTFSRQIFYRDTITHSSVFNLRPRNFGVIETIYFCVRYGGGRGNVLKSDHSRRTRKTRRRSIITQNR